MVIDSAVDLAMQSGRGIESQDGPAGCSSTIKSDKTTVGFTKVDGESWGAKKIPLSAKAQAFYCLKAVG